MLDILWILIIDFGEFLKLEGNLKRSFLQTYFTDEETEG